MTTYTCKGYRPIKHGYEHIERDRNGEPSQYREINSAKDAAWLFANRLRQAGIRQARILSPRPHGRRVSSGWPLRQLPSLHRHPGARWRHERQECLAVRLH